MKREIKYVWLCQCNAGWCDFKTEEEANESNHGKFCGGDVRVKKIRLEKVKEFFAKKYKKEEKMGEEYNSIRCSAHVYSGQMWDFAGHRCNHKSIKNGLCKMHQPENIKARMEKRDIGQEEASNRPMYSQNHVNKLNATIASLRYKVDTTKGMWAFGRDLNDVDFKWIRRNALN